MELPALLPDELRSRIPAGVLPDLEAWIAARFAGFEARVKHLEQRLGTNSTNSSLPPSRDPIGVKRPPPQAKSGKKRGGQPGHRKHSRAILPPTSVVACRPSHCGGCGSGLSGTDAAPELYQHIDIPPIAPVVTHFLLHSLECKCCGKSTAGKLPPHVIHCDGPGIHALVAHLLVVCRQSRRMVCDLMKDVFGVPMSAGQVVKIQNRTTAVLAPAVAEIRAAVRRRNVNMDETGFPEMGKPRWLWVATASDCAAYVIGNRGHETFDELVGRDFEKICTTDRLGTYHRLDSTRHQYCWAHLLRDFQAMVDRNTAGSATGAALLLLAKAMFGLWFQVRDGTLTRAAFAERVKPIREDVLKALVDGQYAGCKKTKRVCRQLFESEDKLWTFASNDDVEPTNNAAERALRCAAIWRRLCFGTQSSKGSRFVESALTVWQTCKLQGKNAYDYLRNSFEAATRCQRPASLVPGGV